MTNLLGAGLDWLEDQRRRFLVTPVTYRRGTQEIVLDATIGRTVFRLDPGFGNTRIVTRDFLIAVEDLAALGEPQRGDRITEGGRLHEVLTPGGEPHWRWADQNRRCFRIHTKQVTP